MTYIMVTIAAIAAICILDESIRCVAGFSVSSRPAALIHFSNVPAMRTTQYFQSSPSLKCTHRSLSISNLFSTCSHSPFPLRGDSEESPNPKILVPIAQKRIGKFQRIIKKATNQCTIQIIQFWMNCRRPLLSFCTMVLIWFAAAGSYTPVSHGSSVYSSKSQVVQVSRNGILSKSFDQIVDGYVSDRMFDDDVYDPVESIYREAMDDKLKGSHPKNLRETASSVLGQNAMKASKKGPGISFSGVLVKAVDFLRRQGLSEIQAIALITGTFVIGAPSVFFAAFISIASQNKRSMGRLMKQRYGDTYSVDASVKEEEDIDVPEDEDDDDDDDDDDEE